MTDNPNITPSDPSSTAPEPYTYFQTGFRCNCGIWVMPGAFHKCQWSQPQQQTTNPSPDWTAINVLSFHADRIARALERIADALENTR